MSDSAAKISPGLTNTAETSPGGPAPDPWPGATRLLEAIRLWDPRLWQRLDDVITPPGTSGKPPAPLMPSSGVPPPNEDRTEWFEAVALLKQKTRSGSGYILQVLDIGEPHNPWQTATDGWIETILPREVAFANSQILRNQRVFAAWVSSRQAEGVEIRERPRETINKGGRPEKFSWDDFWIEICLIGNTLDGLPDRLELNKRMLGWVAEVWLDPPAESTVRNKIAKLYKKLSRR